ncbi:MAG: GNAT family N-acetyltransferase [Cyanobacteria bacterium CRU_2_1]|nr:GNAT family N-acetyltransferase [Cyanobacteria bacterium RU_5_0]NJR60810.1 GNAT family N-acetyltransferase [Cyanobacteria bacterium CRU_2_1]
MSSSSTDALSPLPHEQKFTFLTSGNSSFFIRTVRSQDLIGLADVLASSFHTQYGWLGWFYPVLRMGIYEDLRSRLHAAKTHKSAHYACLVAVLRGTDADVMCKHQALGFPYLGATYSSDRPIGTVEISQRTRALCSVRAPRYLYISNLAVHADYRRQGIAQQLLQMCDRIALDWGFQDIYLHVLEDNHHARRLYQRSGYRILCVDVNPISWLLKRPRQLLLHKQLSRNHELASGDKELGA